MNQTTNKKDALGNEIIMGKTYGYSQSNNGFVTVKIGKAKEYTDTGLLSLTIDFSRKALYNHELAYDEPGKKVMTVKPASLFPVREEEICSL